MPRTIDEICVEGYRSVRDMTLKLAPVNIIVGPNGCGKTNLYRSLLLIQAAAQGALGRTIAEEGGMPSILWAGERRTKGPVRVTISVASNSFEYQLSLGLPTPGRSAFSLDPEVKEEGIWFADGSSRFRMLERKANVIRARDEEGRTVSFPFSVSSSESALSEIREPARFPILSSIRQDFLDWRFYHQFRTDQESPLRQAQIGCRTPVLSADGRDVAAALQTIREIGDGRALNDSIRDAFPDMSLDIGCHHSTFAAVLRSSEFQRTFVAREFSDGTLKYLCLLAALLSPRPPSLLALNEPEGSLHPDLMKPLARLMALASQNSQLWVTTHSQTLAAEMETLTKSATILLEKQAGETILTSSKKPKSEEAG